MQKRCRKCAQNNINEVLSLHRFSTEDDTAKSPGDYSEVAGSTVTFRAGDSNGATQYGIVSIIDDPIVEATESFTIKLTSKDPGLLPTTFAESTIRINDNDRKNELI